MKWTRPGLFTLRTLRFVPPNLATSSSLVLGIVSIFLSIEGNVESAAWCIIWCTLLDKADGSLARLFRATSRFGVEFDSFADFCAFGLAPAFLVVTFVARFPELGYSSGGALWGMRMAASVFALMAAMRLARFNVFDAAELKQIFLGVPTTLAGGVIAAFLLTFLKYWGWVGLPDLLVQLFPLYLIVLGVLMLSSLPIPKIRWPKNIVIKIIFPPTLAAGYICGICRVFPEYLLILGVVYPLIGSIHHAIASRIRIKDILDEEDRRTEEENARLEAELDAELEAERLDAEQAG